MGKKNQESIKELHSPPLLEKYPPLDQPLKQSVNFFSFKRVLLIVFSLLGCLMSIGFVVAYGGVFKSDVSIIRLKGPCPDFVGRTDYLSKLYKDLVVSSYRNTVKIRGLWGKGGFGKSELAIQFAHMHLSQFSLVWSFCCDNPEQLNQGYRDLAERLQVLAPTDSPEMIQQKVHSYLENTPHSLPWLLIFDNVENNLIDYPQKGGAIIVTSQKKVLAPELLMEVTPFSKQEGQELLERITQKKEPSVSDCLTNDLEGIPLLINYAAHYIRATPGCTIQDYQNLFSTHLLEKEGPLWTEMDVSKRYLKSLAASWQFSLQSLEKESLHAAQWLAICSYLHPEQIPVEWLSEWISQQNIDSHPDQILKSLQNYGLIRYEEKTQTFSIHRFFQCIVRENLKDRFKEDLGSVVLLLSKHSEDYQLDNPISWKKADVLYLHCCEIKKWLDKYHSSHGIQKYVTHEELLYDALSKWCIFNDHFKEGVEMCHKALEIRKKIMDPLSKQIGKTYDRLAWAHIWLGQYSEALNACMKGEEIFGPAIKDTPLYHAGILHSKALILCDMGEYEQSINYNEYVLEVMKKELGESHYRIGFSLNNIAVGLTRMRRYEEALDLFERVSTLEKKVLKEKHPLSASNFANIAWVYYGQKQYYKALNFFRYAESIFMNEYGARKSNLASVWNGIGWCKFQLGKYKEAKSFFRKALHASTLYYGEVSRFAVKARKGLAWCYIKQKHYKKGIKNLRLFFQTGKRLYISAPKRLQKIEQDFQLALKEIPDNETFNTQVGAL